MLTASPAETLQRVSRDVVAPGHRDLLDGVGHLLDRNLDETLCRVFCAQASAGCQCRKQRTHRFSVQRLVRQRPEHLGKMARLELANEHIGVGQGKWSAAPITGRPRVRRSALRTDPETRAIEGKYRAATRRHRMDTHHRCAHANPGDLCFELPFELPRVVRHVGGCAAHVETDHLHRALRCSRVSGKGQFRGARHADDAASRAAEDRVLALERPRIGQATGRLHEEQSHARHFCRYAIDVATQDGRQVGVDHRRVAAADELHERAGRVRSAHLSEADRARDATGGLLVGRVAVPVHEHDGDAAQALVEPRLQGLAQMRFIERLDHVALRTHTFARFHHRAVQQFGQDDMALEQAWPVLVGDAQRIAKAARRDQQRRFALAFEQRVGGDRGSHLHAFHQPRCHRLTGFETKQMAYACDRRVAVVLGVVAEQLVCQQRAIGTLADDVGERSAPVDPELPALCAGSDYVSGHRHGCGHAGSKRGCRARSLIVQTRHGAQRAGHFADVVVHFGVQAVDQTSLAHFAVLRYHRIAFFGGRIQNFLRLLLCMHEVGRYQLLE